MVLVIFNEYFSAIAHILHIGIVSLPSKQAERMSSDLFFQFLLRSCRCVSVYLTNVSCAICLLTLIIFQASGGTLGAFAPLPLNYLLNIMTLFKKTQVGDRRWSREDVDRIKAMVVADFSELLNRQPTEGLQWASTKTDLVELSHLVWESGLLLDERGMPLSFRSIVNRVCAVLNVVPPHNPSGTLEKIRARKNIRVRPVAERYLLLHHQQHILHPMRLDIKRARVRRNPLSENVGA